MFPPFNAFVIHFAVLAERWVSYSASWFSDGRDSCVLVYTECARVVVWLLCCTDAVTTLSATHLLWFDVAKTANFLLLLFIFHKPTYSRYWLLTFSYLLGYLTSTKISWKSYYCCHLVFNQHIFPEIRLGLPKNNHWVLWRRQPTEVGGKVERDLSEGLGDEVPQKLKHFN